jgi:hypothetical protein
VHRYTPRWSETTATRDVPDLDEFVFRDAVDFIEYAAVDRLTTWYTYPWLWHLDQSGRARCFSKGSSLDDVQTFAAEPERVVDCRLDSPGDECPPYWLIIESRPQWLPRGCDVTEGDAAAYIDLRRSLAGCGITLLDDIIVSEQFEWWSLHELTAGTTAWDFTVPDATIAAARSGTKEPRRQRRRRRST